MLSGIILDYPTTTYYFELDNLDHFYQTLENLLNLNPDHVSTKTAVRYGCPVYEVTLTHHSSNSPIQYILVLDLDNPEDFDN